MPLDVSDFHFEHKQWVRELEFWKDELLTFQHRLEEVVTRWRDKDVLAQVEQFQNKFITHNQVIDISLHDVRAHEHELTELAKGNYDPNEKDFVDRHIMHREAIDMQRNMYTEMKKKFFAFLITTKKRSNQS